MERKDFTGSSSTSEPPEDAFTSVPVRIWIDRVEDVTNGKVTRVYYKWGAQMLGHTVAHMDVNDTHPRTRKAAVAQAKRVLRDTFRPKS